MNGLKRILFYMNALFCFVISLCMSQEITPYKFTDADRRKGYPAYKVPDSCRFTIKRNHQDASDIIYYLSRPHAETFPIAILCGGSSLEDDIGSIVHFHRYFLQEFLDLKIGVLTVEQQGVDGDVVNTKEFMEHYTRSNRLVDHRAVIDHIKKNPPKGWDGTFIFLGVSEGGPIVTILTTDNPDCTRATINWSGAGDFSWREELWNFMQDMMPKVPWHIKLRAQLPSWMPFSLDLYFPKSRKDHDAIMDETIKNPTFDRKIAGMTYKYHADALSVYPKPEYEKIKTPYLVVAGEKDTILSSADAFVEKAKAVGAPIMYMRIPTMDHYIRNREDIIKDSFDWLAMQLFNF